MLSFDNLQDLFYLEIIAIYTGEYSASIEDISTFKQQALPKMQETITKFRELAETGEREIARLESKERS